MLCRLGYVFNRIKVGKQILRFRTKNAFLEIDMNIVNRYSMDNYQVMKY